VTPVQQFPNLEAEDPEQKADGHAVGSDHNNVVSHHAEPRSDSLGAEKK